MWKRAAWSRILLLVLATGVCAGARGQWQGPEFRVNVTTADDQLADSRRAIAMDARGNMVVAWSSTRFDSGDIYVRLFDALGQPKTGELLVNQYTFDTQAFPAVAMDGDGNFVVVWHSWDHDFSGYGIAARLFNADGTARSDEFYVNDYYLGDQIFPDVAFDGAGNFLVVWESEGADGEGFGVSALKFDSSGAPLTPEFLVNDLYDGDQSFPAVAMNPEGRFVVVWVDAFLGDTDIHARRFGASALPLEATVRLNDFPSLLQDAPQVGMDAAGNYVAIWDSWQDGSGFDNLGIYARRVSRDGIGSAEFRVHSTTAGHQLNPFVAVDPQGHFMAAWQGPDGSGQGVYAQCFNAALNKVGPEFRINTHTASDQDRPSLAVDAAGQFAAVWTSFGQDATGTFGVYAQRLACGQSADLGNWVFEDLDNDGLFDLSESGIADVFVDLYRDNGNNVFDPGVDEFVTFALTDPDGIYFFLDLPPGHYLVQVGEAEFASGAPLEFYYSSTGNGVAPDPDDNVDDDDNGDPRAGHGVVTRAITLSAGEDNGTLDLGFVPNSAPVLISAPVADPNPVSLP